jgi:hypothetical protein
LGLQNVKLCFIYYEPQKYAKYYKSHNFVPEKTPQLKKYILIIHSLLIYMNNRAFFKNLFSIFITLLYQNYSFAQYRVQDAIQLKDEIVIYNGTTYTAKAWVMCSNYKLILKPDIPHDEKYCYEWITGKIDDYNSPIPSCSLFGYEVKPCSESGIYIINIRDKTTDKILYTYCFVVYIIDRLDIWEQNNLTECMDENSFTKIAGVLVGKGVDRITTSKKIINLYYIAEPTYGTLISTEGLTIYKGRFQSEKVPVPRMDGQFKSVLSSEYLYRIDGYLGEDVGGCGDRIDMKVYRLWITKFHKADAPSPDKWQVVVGEPIVHEVQCINCSNFEWEINNVKFTVINNKNKSGTNLVINEATAKNNNSDFGLSTITVSCLYNGKRIKVSSAKRSLITRYMSSNKQSSLFFNRETLKGVSKIPNWVQYWLYFTDLNEFHPWITAKKYLGSGIFIDPNTGKASQLFGGTVVQHEDFINAKEAILHIYDGASQYEDVGKVYGIEAYTSVLIHESEHIYIMEELWPNGYDVKFDTDLDFYPDKWENDPLKGKNFGFSVGTSGIPDLNDKYLNNYPPVTTADKYEEDVRCRPKQKSSNKTVNNSKDWSWHPDPFKFKYQGKQWK